MIKNFEEIEAWQLARELTKVVYAIAKTPAFAHDFGLRDQIRRASVSIMANIAEGFERDGTNEFIQHLSIAKGSSGEVRSHLYVALDASYIDRQTFDSLFSLSVSISKLIAAFITHLKNSPLKGSKFNRPRDLSPETCHLSPET